VTHKDSDNATTTTTTATTEIIPTTFKPRKSKKNQARQPHLRRSWPLLSIWVFFSAGNLV